MPITAIITPATINVAAAQKISKSTSALHSQLFYDPNTSANLNTLTTIEYLGPSTDVLRAGYSTAIGGDILNIPAPGPNVSYSLQFTGPALSCQPADETLIDAVYQQYLEDFTTIENAYYYFSWVPTTAGKANLSDAYSTLDTVSTDAAHIYIIPNTTMTGPIFAGGRQFSSNSTHYGYQDLIDCKLYNASYSVFFKYTFPIQRIYVRNQELLNPVNVSADISQWYYTSDSPEERQKQAERISYQSLMDTLGRLLVGNEWQRDGFTTTEKSSWALLSINWTTQETAQRGVEELFQNMTLSMMAFQSLT